MALSLREADHGYARFPCPRREESRGLMMTVASSQAVSEERKQGLLGRATAFFVYLFEKIMPDPFVFAVLLTFLGVLLARMYAPNATFPSIASAWYGGVFAIFAVAFPMVRLLVAGYALAISPPVQTGPSRIYSLGCTRLSGISLSGLVRL